MINLNKVVLVGRLTKDIEVRMTASNVPVVSFTLAVDRPKRKDVQEVADFIGCVAFNHSADFLGKYASKGTIVSVEGKIQTRNYDGPNGKVYVTEVISDSVQIITNKPAQSEPAANRQNQQQNAQNYQQPLSDGNTDMFGGNNLGFSPEELPF